MTTSPRGWLAALLIPAVIVSGLTGAVVANAESVSQVRIAQDEYAEAWDHAVAVQSRVESERRDAAALAVRADQLIYTATTFQGLAHLNPESLAALTPLVAALESALAVESPVSAPLPAQLDSRVVADLVAQTDAVRDWAESVEKQWSAAPSSGVPGALAELDAALHAVAVSVAASGDALLASKVGASAETRAALSDAMAAVAASIADGDPTFAAVRTYVTAAQAVVDSQAAADAAAAAAAAAAAEAEEEYVPAPREFCFPDRIFVDSIGVEHLFPGVCVIMTF